MISASFSSLRIRSASIFILFICHLTDLQALLAYHIEALVPPTTQPTIVSQAPQRLNGNKEVQFFSVGNVLGRTLVIYMRKKGVSTSYWP